MENLFTSIRTSFKNRVTSPLLGSFIIAWILWNRNIVYSALFLSQELVMNKYGLLKDEYLIILLYEHYRLLYSIGLPIISIIIIYYIIPYIDEIIYDKDLKNKNKKFDIKLEREKEREKKRSKVLDVQITNEKKEIEILNSQDQIKQEREKEFIDLGEKYQNFLKILEHIKRIIYIHGGKTYNLNINADYLAFSDLNLLINIESDGITLTEKGRYFLKRFDNDKNQLPF